MRVLPTLWEQPVEKAQVPETNSLRLSVFAALDFVTLTSYLLLFLSVSTSLKWES